MPDDALSLPTHTVLVMPGGHRFAAPPGQSLLDAAAQAGLHWPRSCRNGTCRTCLGHVLQGTARHMVPWPGLLPEEHAEGALLACVAQACSDLVVQAPGVRAVQPAPD